jgi:hypothetical protein
MKMSWLALVVASVMTVGSAAGAAPCKGDGSTAAKPLLYYTADYATLDGLELTLLIGLEPATSPQAVIAKVTDACVRTTFVSNSRTWTLHGDDGDTFPRWATAPDEKTIFYLASMPSPDLVHTWAEAQRKHPTHEPSATFKTSIWAFVAANGDQRSVFGFYDQLPDDARLIQAMQAAIDGRTPPILGFDVKTAKVDLGRISAPLTLAVAESQDRDTPVDKADPDGVAFERGDGGAVRAPLSGLTCPSALGELQRTTLFTTGAADGSREVGCRYVSEHMRLAIVETHLKKGESMKDMVTLVLLPVLTQSPSPPTVPKLPREWSEPGAAFFVQTTDGARQGAVLLSSGDWHVEVYALYGADEDGAISGAFSALSAANALRSVGSGRPASGGALLPP